MQKAGNGRKVARQRLARPAVLLIRTLREDVAYLRKELKFYQGKCERLELAVMQSRPGPAANYVERTEQPPKPPIGETEVNALSRFADIKKKWNALSPEEQEKAMLAGNWNPDAAPKPKAKAKSH